MDKQVARLIAECLHDLRRVRANHPKLLNQQESEFRGAIRALRYLGLISRDEWNRLRDVGDKFVMAAQGVSWRSIKKQYRSSVVSPSTPEKVVQDEPASESVSAPSAPGQLRVRGVLVQSRASQKNGKPERVHVQLVSFDGIYPKRNVFPRLGKHWAPASLLVGHQERKGHAVCRP